MLHLKVINTRSIKKEICVIKKNPYSRIGALVTFGLEFPIT